MPPFFSALTGAGGGARWQRVHACVDKDDNGRGRSEQSERSPLRGKLLPLRSSAHKKEEADPYWSASSLSPIHLP